MVAYRKLKRSRGLPVLISLAVLVLLWQGAILLFAIPPFILPSLAAILKYAFTDFGRLSSASSITIFESLSGYVLGSLAGVAVAIAMIIVRPLERCLMPLCVAVNAVPTVAYTPLFLIWFGLGVSSKIALVTLAVGFTMLVNALHGLKQPDDAAVSLMRSFGAGRFGILWRLQLPCAMPSIVTGLRISVPRSVIVAIVAEMLGAYKGLGRVIYESTQQIDLLSVWSAVMFASLASMLLYGLLVWIDQKLVWWR